MKISRVPSAVLALFLLGVAAAAPLAVRAQQPAGVAEDLQNLASEHANHSAFTFDHDMLQTANGLLGNGSGSAGDLSSVTIENYRYHEPAFYIPETMQSLVAAYSAAGWQHLINQHTTPRNAATPVKPLTDLWLHYHGADIDSLTVLIRAPKQMTVVEVTGDLRPLDLVHLGGHFGIPKVDPNAVMVPAPPGR